VLVSLRDRGVEELAAPKPQAKAASNPFAPTIKSHEAAR
jgi:hypothetical protein